MPGGLIENGLVNEVEVVPNNEDGDAEATVARHDLNGFGEVVRNDENDVAEEVVPNNEDGDAEANDGGHDLGEFGEVLPRDEGGVAELSEVRHDANEDGSPVVNEAERARSIRRSNAIRRLN